MKIRGIAAAAALAAATTFAPAQAVSTVYVPDATTTSGAADTVLFNAANGKVAFNLIRGEVGPDSVVKKIVDLAFVPAASGTFSATRLQIRMGRGFLLTLDQCFALNVPCPTIVYDGPFTWNAVKDQWTSLGLQNPYVTDGQSNVYIEIRWQGGTGSVPVRVESQPTIIGSRIYDVTSTSPWSVLCGTKLAEGIVPRTRLSINNQNTFVGVDHNHVGMATNMRIMHCPKFTRYQVVASFTQNNLFDLGVGKLRLDFDPLFYLSVFTTTPMFSGYAGLTDDLGQTSAPTWFVPNIPALAGLCVVHGAVLMNSSGTQVTAVMNTMASDIKPGNVP